MLKTDGNDVSLDFLKLLGLLCLVFNKYEYVCLL